MKVPKPVGFLLTFLGYFVIAALATIGARHLLYEISHALGFSWPPDEDLDWISLGVIGFFIWVEMRRRRNE